MVPGDEPDGLGDLPPIPGKKPGNLTLHHSKAPLTVSPGSLAIATWERYWDCQRDVAIPERSATFRVYECGAASGGPTVLCVHGGGYTALTWSLVAAALKPKCRVVAFDMRGHGATVTEDDADLSATTLAEDAVAVAKAICAAEQPAASIVLVGHSLGGSVAVHAAASKSVSNLAGLFVLDVVEGSALASLVHMHQVLAERPSSFASVQAAIHWSLDSRMTRNPEAACVSVPDMLRVCPDGRVAWKTHLAASEAHWQGWYQGMSDLFLHAPCPKVLMIAGTDRLDKAMTIGQMQGKFQLVMVAESGHCIQEDQPGKVVETVESFLVRFKVGQPLPAFLRH